MIKDSEILFVTTTLYSKWLDYQQDIVKNFFPNSERIVVDGRKNWPKSWFYWIDEVKKSDKKYYIHIDEDFFITSKDEVLRAINKMELENLDLLGVPDGLHHYRGANPVAINSFFMIGRLDKLKLLDFSKIQFNYTQRGWVNNYGLIFKDCYKKDWTYKFKEIGSSNFNFEQEPYYAFMWSMKEIGCKFDYLYPHFDDRFKSTNPRLSDGSNDIGIHMWYTRNWDSDMDVWGMKNKDRYSLVENYILNPT